MDKKERKKKVKSGYNELDALTLLLPFSLKVEGSIENETKRILGGVELYSHQRGRKMEQSNGGIGKTVYLDPVNLLLDEGFNPVVGVCPSVGRSRGTSITVCWICVAGGIVGSDGTLSSTKDGSVLLSERQAVYRGGCSVISGVGDEF